MRLDGIKEDEIPQDLPENECGDFIYEFDDEDDWDEPEYDENREPTDSTDKNPLEEDDDDDWDDLEDDTSDVDNQNNLSENQGREAEQNVNKKVDMELEQKQVSAIDNKGEKQLDSLINDSINKEKKPNIEKPEQENKEQRVTIENSPLSEETVKQIRETPKGERPDPKEYMTQEMIDEHLDKFKDGGSFIMTQDQYDMFVDGREAIGCPDNSQFMTTKEKMDSVLENGNIENIENKLGFDRGHFEDGGGMVRIDVNKPLELNGRMPSGNEMGANERFIPGGYTDGPDGGSPEIVTDKIPNDAEHRSITLYKFDGQED